MVGELTGKIALVTGSSRGLGREIALAFAAAGADVVVSSRRREPCEQVASEIEALGRRALVHPCHAGHWDELDGLVEAACGHFGRVDVLVNNAGKSPTYPSLTEVTESLYDSVVALNLKGPFRLATLVGTRMVDAGGGSIINISSTLSLRPEPSAAPYAAAKAGLNATTIALAQAFAPTVRVNAIVPGGFRTDISKYWDEATHRELSTRPALGRVGEPHEITGAAVYLAGDAASYTTGALLTVDGGLR